MTRKRFVRLMMAEGVRRNEARAEAARVRAYGSYERLWQNEGLYIFFTKGFRLGRVETVISVSVSEEIIRGMIKGLNLDGGAHSLAPLGILQEQRKEAAYCDTKTICSIDDGKGDATE